MANNPGGPTIPRTHHPTVRTIRNLLREDPNLDQEELKRKIINSRCLPPNMNDQFWNVTERSYREELRARRDLFNDRFAIAMRIVQNRS